MGTWHKHPKSIVVRVLSYTLSCTLILSTLPVPLAFGSPADQHLSDATRQVPTSTGRGTPGVSADAIIIPGDWGRIVDRWQPDRLPQGLVVHIQDLHTHAGAQAKISQLIGHLHDTYGIDLVALEGAEGFWDTSFYTTLPDPPSTERVARLFMDEGLFTGAEYYSIAHPGNVRLWGVEDMALYDEHVAAYEQGRALWPTFTHWLNTAERAVNQAKRTHYPRALHTLERARNRYEQGHLEFRGYFKHLRRLAVRDDVSLSDYPQLTRLQQWYDYDAHTDLARVDQEHQALFAELTIGLKPENRAHLFTQAEELEAGKIPPAQYYQTLKSLAEAVGISLEPTAPTNWWTRVWQSRTTPQSQYQHLARYIQLLAWSAESQSQQLTQEIEALHDTLAVRLAPGGPTKKLLRVDQHLHVLRGLLNARLSPHEWTFYQTHQADMRPSRVAARIATVTNDTDTMSASIADRAMPSLEAFYQLAHRRDHVLTERTLDQLDDHQAAILITGGFHTPGMVQQLRKQGVAYIVVAPEVNGELDETLYRRRLAGDMPSTAELIVKLNQNTLVQRLQAANVAIQQRFTQVKAGARLWLGRLSSQELELYAKQRNVQDAEGRYRLPWIMTPWWAGPDRQSAFLHPAYRGDTRTPANWWARLLEPLARAVGRGSHVARMPGAPLSSNIVPAETLFSLLTNALGHTKQEAEPPSDIQAVPREGRPGEAAVVHGVGVSSQGSAHGVTANTNMSSRRQLARVEAYYGFYEDAHPMVRYLNEFARRLRPADWSIEPRVCVPRELRGADAFALPDGSIVITLEMLDLVHTEDELAFLLGHEMTHVQSGHANQTLEYLRTHRLSAMGSMGMPRLHEYEADFAPVIQLIGQAGYYPLAGDTLFQRLKEAARGRDWSAAHGTFEDRRLNMLSVRHFLDLEGLERLQQPLTELWKEEIPQLVRELPRGTRHTPLYDRRLYGLQSGERGAITERVTGAAQEGRAGDWFLLQEALRTTHRRIIPDAVAGYNAQIEPRRRKGPNLGSYGQRYRLNQPLSDETMRAYRAMAQIVDTMHQVVQGQSSPDAAVANTTDTLVALLLCGAGVDLFQQTDQQAPFLVDIPLTGGGDQSFLLQTFTRNRFNEGTQILTGLIDVLDSARLRALGVSFLSTNIEQSISHLLEYLATDRVQAFHNEMTEELDVALFVRQTDQLFARLDTLYRDMGYDGVNQKELRRARDAIAHPDQAAAALTFEGLRASGYTEAQVYLMSADKTDSFEPYCERLMANDSRSVEEDVLLALTSHDTDDWSYGYPAVIIEQSLERHGEDTFFEALERYLAPLSDTDRNHTWEELTAIIGPGDEGEGIFILPYGNEQSEEGRLRIDESEYEKVNRVFQRFIRIAAQQITSRKSYVIVVEYLLAYVYNRQPKTYPRVPEFATVAISLRRDYTLNHLRSGNLIGGLYDSIFKSIEHLASTGETVRAMELLRDANRRFGFNVRDIIKSLRILDTSTQLDYIRRPGAVLQALNPLDGTEADHLSREQLTALLELASLFVDSDAGRRVEDFAMERLLVDATFPEAMQLLFGGEDVAYRRPLVGRSLEHVVEHIAQRPEELEALKDRVLQLYREEGQEEAGVGVYIDAFVHYAYTRTEEFVRAVVACRDDEAPLLQLGLLEWWTRLQRRGLLERSLDPHIVSYYDREEDVREWIEDTSSLKQDIHEEIVEEVEGYTKVSLVGTLNVRELVDRLYDMDVAQRHIVLRKALTDVQNGLLRDRDAVRSLVHEYLKHHVDVDPAALPRVSQVLNVFSTVATMEELYFLLAPLLADVILQKPVRAADTQHVSHEHVVQHGNIGHPDKDESPWYVPLPVAVRVDGRIIASQGRALVEKVDRWAFRTLPTDEPLLAAERAIVEALPGAGRAQQEKLAQHQALKRLAELFQAVGVRFEQVFGQYVNIPPELEGEFAEIFDNVHSQSKLTAHETIRRRAPTLLGPQDRLVGRLGGGSLMTAYLVERDNGSRYVLKVLNPNAEDFIRERLRLAHRIIDELLIQEPDNKIFRMIKSHLLPDLERWLLGDINDPNFLANDREFHERFHGWSDGGPHRIYVPESHDLVGHLRRTEDAKHLKSEEYIEGVNFTRLTVGEADDFANGIVTQSTHQRLIRLIARHHIAQTADELGLVHSDAHPGNFRLMLDGSVAVLDRHFYIELTPRDRAFITDLLSTRVSWTTLLQAAVGQRDRVAREKIDLILTYLFEQGENVARRAEHAAIADRIIREFSVNGKLEQLLTPTGLSDLVVALKGEGLFLPLSLTLLLKNLTSLDRMAQRAGFTGLSEVMREDSAGNGRTNASDKKRESSGPGAWRTSLRYILNWAHRVETGMLLGVPFAGLIGGIWLLGAPTGWTTLLLSALLASLGPLYHAMHYVANPQAASSDTTWAMTWRTAILGALLPLGAQSFVVGTALVIGIVWLTQYHRVRNQRWVMQVVADEAVANDEVTDLLRVLLVRAQAQGLTVQSVKPAAWHTLANQVGLDLSEAEIEVLIARFIDIYNSVLDRSLKEQHEVSSADVTTGVTLRLAHATAGQYASPQTTGSSGAPSIADPRGQDQLLRNP